MYSPNWQFLDEDVRSLSGNTLYGVVEYPHMTWLFHGPYEPVVHSPENDRVPTLPR